MEGWNAYVLQEKLKQLKFTSKVGTGKCLVMWITKLKKYKKILVG